MADKLMAVPRRKNIQGRKEARIMLTTLSITYGEFDKYSLSIIE